MSDDLAVPQIRTQGWGKSTTLNILEELQKAREAARIPKDYRPVVTKNELEFLKSKNPSMSDWWDANSVVLEVMGDHSYESMVGRYEPKEPPTLNRADRRKAKKRK
jgi:hypothetical protein